MINMKGNRVIFNEVINFIKSVSILFSRYLVRPSWPDWPDLLYTTTIRHNRLKIQTDTRRNILNFYDYVQKNNYKYHHLLPDTCTPLYSLPADFNMK